MPCYAYYVPDLIDLGNGSPPQVLAQLTEAGALGMPLQGMVTMESIRRSHQYAEVAQPVAFNPVGQVVGMINESESVRRVMQRLSEEYLGAVDRLDSLQPK